MPQLDPTSFASQLFWLMLSFVVLYVLLARVLLPRVQSVLALRAKTIESDIAQAEHLRSEAVRASEQYEKTMNDARAKSQAMFTAAQAEIAEKATTRQAELEAMTEKRIAESEMSIRSARNAVKEKLAPVAGDLASLIVEVIVQQKPDAKDIGTVINSLAKEGSL